MTRPPVEPPPAPIDPVPEPEPTNFTRKVSWYFEPHALNKSMTTDVSFSSGLMPILIIVLSSNLP